MYIYPRFVRTCTYAYMYVHLPPIFWGDAEKIWKTTIFLKKATSF